MKAYRLGDFIRFHERQSLNWPKESIANQYFRKSFFPKNKRKRRPVRVDFKTLAKIIDDKNLPIIDHLAIHLRLGDEYDKRAKIEQYIETIKNNISLIKTRKCKIYCKSHKPKRSNGKKYSNDDFHNLNSKTNNYLYKLINEIKNLGFSFAEQKPCHVKNPWQLVDQDFLELASSKYLIAGKRGFGWLSACMNKSQVFWDIYEMQNNIPNLIWDTENLKQPNHSNFAHHITHLEGFIFQKKRQFKWQST